MVYKLFDKDGNEVGSSSAPLFMIKNATAILYAFVICIIIIGTFFMLYSSGKLSYKKEKETEKEKDKKPVIKKEIILPKETPSVKVGSEKLEDEIDKFNDSQKKT